MLKIPSLEKTILTIAMMTLFSFNYLALQKE
jgi:hypothetical protein